MSLPTLDENVLEAISKGSYAFPHDVLGAHAVGGGVVIRCLRPLALSLIHI